MNHPPVNSMNRHATIVGKRDAFLQFAIRSKHNFGERATMSRKEILADVKEASEATVEFYLLQPTCVEANFNEPQRQMTEHSYGAVIQVAARL